MKTILFSNVVGDVFDKKGKVSFLPKMKEVISTWALENPEIVYVDAPMKGYDNLQVFENIKKCFFEIFSDCTFYFVGEASKLSKINNKENVIYFLTGGNPLTQREIIKNSNIAKQIKNAKYCIGFCAGAMNLSEYGVLTSDEDFDRPMIYPALGRVPLSIEPHFNFEIQQREHPKEFEKRVKELCGFVKEINKPIYAVPDDAFFYFDDEQTIEFGEVVKFEDENGKVEMKRKNIMSWNGVEFEAIIATPACGKSYLCDKYPERFVDADEVRCKLKYCIPEGISREEYESTKGERQFARRMSSEECNKAIVPILDRFRHEGKILISAPHPEMFDYFQSRDIRVCFIFPNETMREEVKKRFVERGNPQRFIKENDEMFDNFVKSNEEESRVAMKYAFRKDEYLENILKKFGLMF